MDAATIREVFGRAVMAGCLAVSVALVAAGLALVAKRAVRWSARTVRRVGVATFLVIGILAAWATYTGTPTNESKSDAAQRLEGEAGTNRLAGAGMLSTGWQDRQDGPDGGEKWRGVSDTSCQNGGMQFGGACQTPSAKTEGRVHEESPSVRPLTDADYAAGFALARIGTGETWDFAPPPGAEVSDDWTRFGAARDWFRASGHVDDGAWGAGFAFPFGTNVLGALTVFSHGTVRPDTADASTFISPLDADLGIVPESNWPLLPFNAGPADRRDDGPYQSDVGFVPSQFWHCLTPSNSFVMTWRNVLLGRDPASPVSFQAELFGNGDVVFRYDLSRLAADPVTNVVVGMSNAGGGRAFASLARSTTSLRWARLDPSRADDPDPDGDGVPTADEVFTHFTDPYRADTDMDGLSDHDEVNVEHAFASAQALSTVVSGLPRRRKFMIAHSLGNMLVSAAAQDKGLAYERYFMLNAAVPVEAYDTSSDAVNASTQYRMTPPDWRGYPDRVRAAHWHGLFGTNDARRNLTWKGRFAAVRNTVNYYSSEEEVLKCGDGEDHNTYQRPYAWYNQERYKGDKSKLQDMVGFGRNEGGWGFNTARKVQRSDYDETTHGFIVKLVPPTVEQVLAADWSEDSLKETPFFSPFEDPTICTSNLVSEISEEYRAQLLADAIPAESLVAGSSPVPAWNDSSGWERNLDMAADTYKDPNMQSVLGRGSREWVHSFFISVPYSVVHALYEEIVSSCH